MQTDERRGLPSISGLERLALCPGSWTLTQFVSALYQSKTPKRENLGAESGTRIHSALSGEEQELSRFENWTMEKCQEYEKAVLEQLKDDYGFVPAKEEREVRKEFYANGKVVMTGKDDVTYYSPSTQALLVVDYKTGTIGAGDVGMNYQLTGYAVTDWQYYTAKPYKWKVKTVFVALIQPNAPSKITVASMSVKDLQIAETGIANIVEKSLSGTTERHADIEKQCKYCPAKGFCPEFRRAAEAEIVSISPMVNNDFTISKDTVKDLMEIEPIDKVIALYEKRGILDAINDAVSSRIKRMLANNPDSVPGYMLGSSGAVRSIPDLDAAFDKIADLISYAEFAKIFKISVPELETLHKGLTGLKGQACTDDFKERFDDVIISVPKELAIRKKKAI